VTFRSRSAAARSTGLLGHNGAGKSTTLGIILGMVMPDGGDVTIDGISVLSHRSKALRKVGAIFESPAFYDYLSGWENLKILMSYSTGFDAKAALETVERVGLSKRIHSKVRTYSHGMRQRLALAQSLLPEPEVILLDEPTDGLDPEGIKWFRDFILKLRDDRGMTVLFNSHLLAEVELMCDRVAILREGKRVFEGTVGGLHEDDQVFDADFETWENAIPIIRALGGEVTANQPHPPAPRHRSRRTRRVPRPRQDPRARPLPRPQVSGRPLHGDPQWGGEPELSVALQHESRLAGIFS
jgi:ABC-2 type transport system ATP-binding protein